MIWQKISLSTNVLALHSCVDGGWGLGRVIIDVISYMFYIFIAGRGGLGQWERTVACYNALLVANLLYNSKSTYVRI